MSNEFAGIHIGDNTGPVKESPSESGAESNRRDRATIHRQAWSVGLATGAYGISFGALSVAGGLSIAQTQILSLAMFSGASQFAFISIAPLGAFGAAIGTAALLGVRNGFYAVAMNPVLGVTGWRKVAAAHLTIDESTAVSTAAQAAHPNKRALGQLGFWSTGIAVFVCWNLATLAGAILGNALGDPRRYGLDAAAAAAFVALLWPRLQGWQVRLLAGLALVVAVALAPFVPAGIPVLVAAGIAMLWTALTSKWSTTKQSQTSSDDSHQALPGLEGDS